MLVRDAMRLGSRVTPEFKAHPTGTSDTLFFVQKGLQESSTNEAYRYMRQIRLDQRFETLLTSLPLP